MGWKVALVLCLGTTTLASGCNIFSIATHNVVNDPAQGLTEVKLRQQMNAMAREAWKNVSARHPPGTYSGAYADGFIQGYADHLDNGGTPGSPAAPPPNYRRHADDFTPAGLAAQKDYLDGFQHGAEAAAATGCRRNFVIPVILPTPKPEQPLNINCLPDSSGARPMPPVNPPPMPNPTAPTTPVAPVAPTASATPVALLAPIPVPPPVRGLMPLSDARAALPAAPPERAPDPSVPAAGAVAPQPHPAVPAPELAPEPRLLPSPVIAPDPRLLPLPEVAPEPRPLESPVVPGSSGCNTDGGRIPDPLDSALRTVSDPARAAPVTAHQHRRVRISDGGRVALDERPDAFWLRPLPVTGP